MLVYESGVNDRFGNTLHVLNLFIGFVPVKQTIYTSWQYESCSAPTTVTVLPPSPTEQEQTQTALICNKENTQSVSHLIFFYFSLWFANYNKYNMM